MTLLPTPPTNHDNGYLTRHMGGILPFWARAIQWAAPCAPASKKGRPVRDRPNAAMPPCWYYAGPPSGVFCRS
jgi:hypothetical protein